jgi:hypothetical protein
MSYYCKHPFIISIMQAERKLTTVTNLSQKKREISI